MKCPKGYGSMPYMCGKAQVGCNGNCDEERFIEKGGYVEDEECSWPFLIGFLVIIVTFVVAIIG